MRRKERGYTDGANAIKELEPEAAECRQGTAEI